MPGGEEVEPFNNRYYYTYETKPTGKTSTVTISKTEAFVKDTTEHYGKGGCRSCRSGSTRQSGDEREGKRDCRRFYKLYLFQGAVCPAGTYTITTAKKYKYRVDRLDESKRYIETTWLVTSYEFVGFDNTTDSYSRQVVMK